MKVEIKKILWPSIISSFIMFILGLLLFFKSAATLMSISYVIGGILIACGVLAVLRFVTQNTDVFNQLNIIYGIVCILGGIFFIKEPEIIGSLMPVFLGITIIVSSSLKIQQALILRSFKSSYWLGSLITALLALICGVILLFNPFTGAVVITKVIGLFLIIYAILDIINTVLLKKSNTVSVEIGPMEDTKRTKKEKVKDAQVIKEVKKKTEDID